MAGPPATKAATSEPSALSGSWARNRNSSLRERTRAAMAAPVSKVLLSSFFSPAVRAEAAMKYSAMRSKDAWVTCDRLDH